MKRFIFFITAIVFSLIFINGNIPPQKPNSYTRQWEKVKELQKKGLPKSALKIIDNIYKSAKKENNNPQILKALIYKASLKSTFEEDVTIKSIYDFEKELKTAREPEKSILYSLLGELYQSYFSQNRYKILNRSITENSPDDNIRIWDAKRFNKKINKYYLLSVSNKKLLKSIDLKNYSPILNGDKKPDFSLRPTLYDLLAQRAIDYFSTPDASLFDFVNTALDTTYLVPANKFVKIDLHKIEGGSNAVILGLFQDILKLHFANNDYEALVDADIKRVNYLKQKINERYADKYYEDALIWLIDYVKNSENMMPAAYQLASFYYNSGQQTENIKPVKSGENFYERAEKICLDAINSYPRSKWKDALKGILNNIHRHSLNFTVADCNTPGSPILAITDFKNIDTVFVKIVPYQFEIEPVSWNEENKKMEKLSKNKGVFNKMYVLPTFNDFREHSTEIAIDSLPLGYYIVYMSDNKSFAKGNTVRYKKIQVSNLTYMEKSYDGKKSLGIYVLNRISGKTVPKAHITVYRQRFDNRFGKYRSEKTGEYSCNDEGYVEIPADYQGYSNRFLFDISNGYDHYYSNTSVWFWDRGNIKQSEHTYFFTDRAIYRPGQTVYFKAIAVKQTGNKAEVIKNKPITVNLLDANYKNTGNLKLTTNEFGSVQGSFVLPTGKLNGRFTLRSGKGSVSFRVEEYKRPTFYVSFDTIHRKYKLNDIVEVQGKAAGFSGNPLTGAKVKYRVTRKKFIKWPYYGFYFPFPQQNRETEITNGELITNDQGNFEITFKALPDENKNSSNYYFTVYADVIDITGETHSSSSVIIIGKLPYFLNIDIPETVVRETNNGITLSAKNLSGEYVDVNAVLNIYKITPPDRILTERPWRTPDTLTIDKNKFISMFPHLPYGNENNRKNRTKEKILSQDVTIKRTGNYLKKEIEKLSPGEYLITAVSKAGNGTIIKDERYITVYSIKSKKLPVNKILWFTVNKNTVEPGENLTFYMGSAANKTRGFLEIYANGNLLKRQWVKLSKKIKTVTVTVSEEQRGVIVAKLSTIRFNSGNNKTEVIEVPFNNKKLTVSLETNRNFLTPGKKEEWKVNIKGHNNEPVVAELLAGMYDASLDEFAKNNWKLNLYHANRNVKTWNISGFSFANGNVLFNPEVKYFSPPAIVYPQINWFGFRSMGYGYTNRNMLEASEVEGQALYQLAAPVAEQKSVTPKAPVPENNKTANFDGGIAKPPVNPEKEKNEPEKFQYRSNFNETAFFYPQLYTDSTGNVSFSFTTPDALTQWKIMMIAHTPDMKTGTLVKKIKAHKDLMIFPNKPRFVRSGDILDFTGKLVNFTENRKTAEVTISFFNPFDNSPIKVMDGKSEIKTTILLPASKSISFSEKITIPGDMDLLGYRIKAVTDNFTDGIEDMIPVLPNKMLVTETMPMTVKGNQAKKFHFKKFIYNNGKTLQALSVDNYKYTVEFTSHPVWYVVQALPYLSQPRYPSAQNIFNVFYSNSIASGIVNKYPQIKTVLEQWKHYSPDAFLSNLQKNEELKSVILDATPWVLEAENETEQKHRIALLFDINNLSGNLDQSLEKLKELQLPSGAWPWFKGMYADRYTTQKIVSGFARLQKMNFIDIKSDKTVKSMLQKAVYYLDNQITKDYNELKKTKNINLKKDHIGALQINWLYMRTAVINIFPVKDKNREAFEYYVSQANDFWIDKNNYLQAMTAIAMQRLGHKNGAEAIIRSLTERSLENEELGMYWRNENGWNWYQAPVETEVMIMEAYDEVMKDRKSVEKMKIWLLKNKQTNRWKTSSATADAVFGILMRGNDLLKETAPVSVKVGDISLLNDTKPQAGTGYIKNSWVRKEIKPGMGVITISNPNKTIVWGSAYYQYFKELDKISKHQTVLQVHKKYFVEKTTPEGVVAEPLKEKQKLKTGQKIVVRLVIKTDRTMEYVHLKDMRAATFEPVDNISGTQFKGGLVYYQNIKDASTDFFFNRLNKGTYVLEYSLRVTQKGSFSSGIATIQCFYAPEFASHTQGIHIVAE